MGGSSVTEREEVRGICQTLKYCAFTRTRATLFLMEFEGGGVGSCPHHEFSVANECYNLGN